MKFVAHTDIVARQGILPRLDGFDWHAASGRPDAAVSPRAGRDAHDRLSLGASCCTRRGCSSARAQPGRRPARAAPRWQAGRRRSCTPTERREAEWPRSRRRRRRKYPVHSAAARGGHGAQQAVRRQAPSIRSRSAFLASWWPTGRRSRSPRLGELLSQVPRAQGVPGCLRQMRRLHRQVPLLPRHADPKNMPVARQDLLRSVYRRYFTFAGKLFPKLVGARDMTKEVLDDWYSYFHQCSQCRRCSVFCPYGIDTAEITMAAREIMDSVGLGQKYSNEIIGKVHKIGNNLGLPGPALRDTLEGLEEDVKEATGVDVRFPLDEKGAEVLLVTPSRRLLRRAAHRQPDRLRQGVPCRRHLAGRSPRMPPRQRNFGLFIGNYDQLQKIAAAHPRGGAGAGREAHRRGRVRPCLARRLQLLEHADRAVRFPRSALSGAAAHLRAHLRPHPRAARSRSTRAPTTTRWSPSTIPATSRAARAWATCRAGSSRSRATSSAPCANKFVDMAPETIGETTFCCGGGGGLLTDDLLELRVKGALPRMEALQQVVEEHGVNFMATICAICKASSPRCSPTTSSTMDMVGGVHQPGEQRDRAGAEAMRRNQREIRRWQHQRASPSRRAAAPFRRLQGRRPRMGFGAGTDLHRRRNRQVPDLRPQDAALPGRAARRARTFAAGSTSCAASRSRRRRTEACHGRNTRSAARPTPIRFPR